MSIYFSDESSNFVLGRGIAAALLKDFAAARGGRVEIAADSGVLAAQPALCSELCRVSGGRLIAVPAGEASKCSAGLSRLCSSFLEDKADRSVPAVALGGGVTGDLAGFASSVFMRGMPFVQIPTTLLAMVDSSIGGKNGINLPEGKNLLGTFHFPDMIIADTEFLDTLPDAEWSCGLAELIKTALLSPCGFFDEFADWCRRRLGYGTGWEGRFSITERIAALRGDADFLLNIIKQAASFKLFLVKEDPFDSLGRRAVLNLGHTFAHAFEASVPGKIPHGRAVAAGIVCSLYLSAEMGILKEPALLGMKGMFGFWGLPEAVPEGITSEEFVRHLVHDKKSRHGRRVFVLLESKGCAVSTEEVSESDLAAVLHRLLPDVGR